MRVIVNQQATEGQKTGVGHYTSELVRFLRALPGGPEIDCRPSLPDRRASKIDMRGGPVKLASDTARPENAR